MSMYVRLKRKNQTIFLHVDKTYTFLQIKQKVGNLLGMDASFIQLIANDKKRELVDMATISDQEIQNDDIIYMCFAKESGGEFEELQVDTLALFGEEPGNSSTASAS